MPKLIRRAPAMAGTTFIGIDPGKKGGLVALNPDGSIEAVTMPSADKDLWQWFLNHSWQNSRTAFAAIEKVGGYIKGREGTGAAMFTFGSGYGKLLMALTAAGIPHVCVPPNVWQQALGVPPRKKRNKKTGAKGETDSEWKNRLKDAAQRRFPTVDVTLATADALLIADYCRRYNNGTLRRT